MRGIGLLWNFDDENIVKHKKIINDGGKKFDNYIDDAYPRISIEGNSEINHFDLIEFVVHHNKDYKEIVANLSKEENENKIIKMLEREFFKYFIPERRELITYIINRRFEKVRGIINE